MSRGFPRKWRNTPTERPTRALDSTDCIESFSGPYKFLSNFFWSKLEFEGLIYPSVEHAFQAAKLKDNEARSNAGFTNQNLSFKDAKHLGRNVALRDDWKEIREAVMASCLRAKFSDATLETKLKGTGQRELIDGHWGSPDLIWGYHYPSQAGENRLGKLLMELREQLRNGQAATGTSKPISQAAPSTALYHLDWPMKCLHDGLPDAYKERICRYATDCNLGGILCVLRRRNICIALSGSSHDIEAWERRMTTENVDVNSRGRPCRERMLAQLFCQASSGNISDQHSFAFATVESWAELQRSLRFALNISLEQVSAALGPEPPPLPNSVKYTSKREGVILDGKLFPLCLNDNQAHIYQEALLGNPANQVSCGDGEAVPLVYEGKPSIFGGRFARAVSVLQPNECTKLQAIAEEFGFGLAGSRGFNPFARFALRCLVDAPSVAAALTARLKDLLPKEYPPNSGRHLIGINDRLRFLKYTPGMHHSGDHTDCAHEDEQLGKSFLTVQLYLNSDFSGGRTTFISNRLVPVEPAAGTVVVFDHELYHRGGQVTHGTKYAVRMDVMYSHPHSVQYQDSTPNRHAVKKQESTPNKCETVRQTLYSDGGGYPEQSPHRRRWAKR